MRIKDMNKRYEGKIAIVTGGANGLGRGMVERLVEEGAKVAVFDIETDTMAEVFAGKEEDIYCITCDVADYKAVNESVAKVVEKWGQIDVLFNNAGIIGRVDILNDTEENWRRVVDVNLNGVFFVAQAVLKHMVEKGIKGNVVNTSSCASQIVSPATSAYSASKHGVTGFTKYAALEMAKYGIRVNAFGPGTSMTRITLGTRNDPERCAKFLQNIPMNRFGEIEEAVAVALFLGSDEASYITGVTYLETGGFELF